jgi:hypothetical protein
MSNTKLGVRKNYIENKYPSARSVLCLDSEEETGMISHEFNKSLKKFPSDLNYLHIILNLYECNWGGIDKHPFHNVFYHIFDIVKDVLRVKAARISPKRRENAAPPPAGKNTRMRQGLRTRERVILTLGCPSSCPQAVWEICHRL